MPRLIERNLIRGSTDGDRCHEEGGRMYAPIGRVIKRGQEVGTILLEEAGDTAQDYEIPSI